MTASWPLQALMAEVMSEAARKSAIAMMVEKLWRIRLISALWDRWRAEPIYWWDSETIPPTATTQSVRNHQCPSVCYHIQLTTWVHSTKAWTGGQGMCQFVLYQVDSLRMSEVKLRRTYTWTDFDPEASFCEQSGVKLGLYLVVGRDV